MEVNLNNGNKDLATVSAKTDGSPAATPPLRLKVCGMTRLDQVYELDAAGVEFAGFIFYHKSPRLVTRHLTGEELKKARLKINKVGVFVNASYEEIMNQVEQYGLYMVQLHGDESPRF